MNPQAPKPFGLVGSTLKWVGLSGLFFGFAGSAIAVASFVQNETGWGMTAADRCCGAGTHEVNMAALALLLGCMFFVLAGAGLVLISRPLLVRKHEGPVRWPRWVSRGLFVYSACSFSLAVILILYMTADSTAILVGMVTYCVMVGGGLLIASWGLKRFADAG